MGSYCTTTTWKIIYQFSNWTFFHNPTQIIKCLYTKYTCNFRGFIVLHILKAWNRSKNKNLWMLKSRLKSISALNTGFAWAIECRARPGESSSKIYFQHALASSSDFFKPHIDANWMFLNWILYSCTCMGATFHLNFSSFSNDQTKYSAV